MTIAGPYLYLLIHLMHAMSHSYDLFTISILLLTHSRSQLQVSKFDESDVELRNSLCANLVGFWINFYAPVIVANLKLRLEPHIRVLIREKATLLFSINLYNYWYILYF